MAVPLNAFQCSQFVSDFVGFQGQLLPFVPLLTLGKGLGLLLEEAVLFS